MNKEVRILKFGGSSLKDFASLESAVAIAESRFREGLSLVVVVSARGETTETLLDYASRFTSDSPREMDMLLTSGERISAALFAMGLVSRGVPAVSLTGSQAGIITDAVHTNARILEIRPARVEALLSEGKVVVVGGFQGVSYKKEITTLGRGGSDVTATALASSLHAKRCEIFSDIDGVYSANPADIPKAEHRRELSYEEMQSFGEAGAKVLHPRAIDFAKKTGVIIECKSTFHPNGKTSVIKGFESIPPHRIIGVASERAVALLEPTALPLDLFYQLLERLEQHAIAMKQFSFSFSDESVSGSFVLSDIDEQRQKEELSFLSDYHPNLRFSGKLSAVSLVGAGVSEYSFEVLSALQALQKEGIVPRTMHTTSYRISFIIERISHDKALSLLHQRYVENG